MKNQNQKLLPWLFAKIPAIVCGNIKPINKSSSAINDAK